MHPNREFLLQSIIEKYPRFQIQRRIFQDYTVLRTYNAEKFNRWSEWTVISKLPGGDIDFAITQLKKLEKESENSKITVEYALVNNYPDFQTEIDYYNHMLKLQKK